MSPIGGTQSTQGAQGAQKAGGGGNIFDPLGILPKALNPMTHIKQLLSASPLKALLGGGK